MSQNYSSYNAVKACLYLQEIDNTYIWYIWYIIYIHTKTFTQLYPPLNAVIPIIGEEGVENYVPPLGID